MKTRGLRRKTRQKALRLVAAAAFGGSVFQLSGCDPSVRTTVLTGLATTTNSLADTLISAFFTGLQANSGSGDGFTTSP
jgi:hypothetical protein